LTYNDVSTYSSVPCNANHFTNKVELVGTEVRINFPLQIFVVK
jgi:hypothetical protein